MLAVWIGGQLNGTIAPTTPYGSSKVMSRVLPESRTWLGIDWHRLANRSKIPLDAFGSKLPRAWDSGLPLSLVSRAAISSAFSRIA